MMAADHLTRNFSRGEFACKCGCGFDAVDHQLVEGLQRLRDTVGASVIVTSGCRCLRHNSNIGGSPRSQHLLGKAADIVVRGYDPGAIASIAATLPEFRRGGIGQYRTFTHVDVRDGASRWKL
jgi:uncharacterized protein YcbK (DUF882 family)